MSVISKILIGETEYETSEYTIPDERTFREAWDKTGETAITVDMAAAREIWRQKIRNARVPEFEKLDAEYMKALETSSDTTAIVAKKQALRDAPADPAIDAATTPDQLKAFQPIDNVDVGTFE